MRFNKLKIKPKGTYVLGICDCGFSRRFESVKDFKIPYDEEIKAYQLNETFCCPKCSKEYDYIEALQHGNKTKDKIGEHSVYIAIGLILFFIFAFPVIKGVIEVYKKDDSTITNREKQEFNDWNNKKSQKEWENQKFDGQ